MPSQALYRKWRSQTFQELIGQEAVVRTLKNALHSGRIAHAYLFCGPRGTGKTSAARLLAKTVNCQNPQNGEPCNACTNCREITENRSLDVIEIDAASNRGIDEIRDLRNKVGYSPGNSSYKVYVLDEAHMLTADAWNALLKTLEEPPPHVIFVLATTEAHRILPTVLSRCQRFDFKRISFRDTVARLLYVAGQEEVSLENGAAELLSRAAGGGMRDALSLLDQAIAAMGETVTQTGVQQMLGLADPHAVRDLVAHVAFLRGAEGLHLINHLAEAGADLRQVSAQVAEYWRAMMLARAGADIVDVLDRTPEEAGEIRQLAESFALDELSACARLFSQNDVGARSISIPQLAVELAFVDCLHLHRQRVGGASAAPPGPSRSAPPLPANRPSPASTPDPRPLAGQTAPAVVSSASASASAGLAQPPSSASEQNIREAATNALREEPAILAYGSTEEVEILDLDVAAAPVSMLPARVAPSQAKTLINNRQSASADAAVFDASQFADEDEEEAGASEGAAATQPGLALEAVTRQWEMVKKACKTKTASLAALLKCAHPVAVTGEDGCVVALQVEYDFHYKKLLEPESRSVIEWALKEILQVPCRVRFLQKDEPIPASTSAVSAPPVSPPIGTHPAHSGEPQGTSTAPRLSVPQASLPAPIPEAPTPSPNGAAPGGRFSNALPSQNGNGAPGTARTTGASQLPPAPADPLEGKIRQDAVIEEIIQTYAARLVEWEPLGEDM